SVGDLLRQAETGSLKLPPASPRPAAPTASMTAEAGIPYAASAPSPASKSEGEPALAVDDMEDPAEPGSSPEFAKIKSRWREILEKVAAQKKSLEAVLRDTHPKKLDEGTLVLACLGPFHQEQMTKPE